MTIITVHRDYKPWYSDSTTATDVTAATTTTTLYQ